MQPENSPENQSSSIVLGKNGNGILDWNGLRFHLLTFKRQLHKMVKHTQIIYWQIEGDLFKCVWPFCGVGA